MTDVDDLEGPPARPLPETESRSSVCEGGKLMPLDVVEDPRGNVAVTHPHRGTIYARVLHKGEDVDRPLEWRAMPHFATCRTHPAPPQNVIDLAEQRAKRKRRR